MRVAKRDDMTDAQARNSIPELLRVLAEADSAAASSAGRALLDRKDECIPHLDEVVRLLGHRSAAIADFAYVILKRIGEPAGPSMIAAFGSATGDCRSHLLALLAGVGDLETILPILVGELKGDSEAMRFHAANCLGRRLGTGDDLPDQAVEALRESVQLLRSTKDDPRLQKYCAQARMTLRRLGIL